MYTYKMIFLVENYGILYFRYNLHSIHMKAVEIHSIWKFISAVLSAAFVKVRNSWIQSNLFQAVVISEGVKNSSPLNSL